MGMCGTGEQVCRVGVGKLGGGGAKGQDGSRMNLPEPLGARQVIHWQW